MARRRAGFARTILAADGRDATVRKEEDVPLTALELFHSRADADVTFEEIRPACTDWLQGADRPASPKTIYNYMDALKSFEKSLVLHGKPATLAHLTPVYFEINSSATRTGTYRLTA